MSQRITALPSIHQAAVRQARRDATQSMIAALGADSAPADIQSFIAFGVLVGLDEGQIRERLPGAIESCDIASMSPELRRLHIERMNRPCEEDRQKI
ncbi:hypothetical protein AB835_08150 [Candidatus Endobugula sertula]|uniref:Uncharacterized protein n=1 Tax=Candidatus Endobugula sertula TaxID=62101 RepID=A0A1D2QPP8_9GAMM|nr:hypothetical protein AB835_08150 [Candidatus Endobugula sertula]